MVASCPMQARRVPAFARVGGVPPTDANGCLPAPRLNTRKGCSMKAAWLPSWLTIYDRNKAMQDLVAGIVVTILLVPQSLAYAMLAGLPAHVGMYASILPLVAYTVFGSSMTLSVGPVAVASLMTASAVAPLAAAGARSTCCSRRCWP